MVSLGTLCAFAIVSAAVPIIRRKRFHASHAAQTAKHGRGFRVPFGPYLIPGLSVLSCIYIMKDLPLITYAVFGIWMGCALMGYFIYAIKHSHLGRA